MRVVLLDTGPIVAFLDRGEARHEEAVEVLATHPGALMTTGAVVTESMHFLRGLRGGALALADFLETGGVEVVDYAQPSDVRRAATLMNRYTDTPMDFADATLVLLAEAVGAGEIFTFDRRGFSTYRFGRNRVFRIVR